MKLTVLSSGHQTDLIYRRPLCGPPVAAVFIYVGPPLHSIFPECRVETHSPEPQWPEGRLSRRVGCHTSAANKLTCHCQAVIDAQGHMTPYWDIEIFFVVVYSLLLLAFVSVNCLNQQCMLLLKHPSFMILYHCRVNFLCFPQISPESQIFVVYCE